MEKDKVDQAALGYDYRGETEKHQSQKGELKSELWHQIGTFCRFIPFSNASSFRLLQGLRREVRRGEGESG